MSPLKAPFCTDIRKKHIWTEWYRCIHVLSECSGRTVAKDCKICGFHKEETPDEENRNIEIIAGNFIKTLTRFRSQ